MRVGNGARREEPLVVKVTLNGDSLLGVPPQEAVKSSRQPPPANPPSPPKSRLAPAPVLALMLVLT